MAINKAGETTSRVLFSTYQSWCGDNNVVAESQRGFTAALLKEYPKLKLDKNRQGERAVKGIVLGSSADESEIPF